MPEQTIISADSHFVEPPSIWAERIDKKFKDRAPHTVRGLNGKEGEFFVCGQINPLPVAAFFGAGVKSADLPEHNKKGFDAAPASVWDPAARIKDQDLDGVRAEVIYTSMGMPLYGLDDVELRVACFRAFNDWATEYCSYDLKRLMPLGLITLEDIGAGIAELMEHDLIERGVPKEKILRVAEEGDSTLEQAETLAKFVQTKKWHSAIVVTSNYHTRRARYIFRHVFQRGIDVRVASARDGDFDPETWWEKRKSSKLFMREILEMTVTVWERRHGTDTSSTSSRNRRREETKSTICSIAIQETPNILASAILVDRKCAVRLRFGRS